MGFATLSTVACFTAGTMIAVPGGERRIEALQPGDLVLTLDHGPRPVRSIGHSLRRAIGPNAPIHIRNCAILGEGELRVSSNHAVMLQHAHAELLFDSFEVLVRAKDLLGLPAVTREDTGRAVLYVHLLLDAHEIVTANGIWAETYLPGGYRSFCFDQDTQVSLERQTMGNRVSAARPILRRYEVNFLASYLPLSASEGGRQSHGGLSRAAIR